MKARVVIRDTRVEEEVELFGELTSLQLDRLDRIAEQVARGTDWTVTLRTEGVGDEP